jgi:hypothetical protein
VVVVGGDDGPEVPTEPVGTIEAASGVTASARLIDHTWGLEVLLDVEGLEPGAAYEMAFVGRDGERYGAGGFVGVPELMRCRNNGAVLRRDVASVEVTGPDGAVALRADLA